MARNHKKSTRFSADETSVFCEQIAMLLHSGIPLYEGIYMLFEEMEDKRTKSVLEQLYESMKVNEMLYIALKNTNSFPDYMIHMVQVGETTGKLEEVMKSLAVYYERESNVKASIKSAVAYPSVLFGMMAVIILVLVFKILPMFESMFMELNSESAYATRSMMNLGVMAGKLIAVITLILLAVLIAGLIWYQTKSGEYKLKRFFMNFHLTKKLSEAMSISNFISSMALMISSGLEMEQALDMAYGACSHRKVKEKIKKCKVLLNKNIPLEEAIHETKLLVGMDYSLVKVAAKTGSQDLVFERLSEQYNTRITEMLSHLSTKIETILVVVLAVIIGAVLISVMLPLVSMISSIG